MMLTLDNYTILYLLLILEFTQGAADMYAYINDIAPIVGVPIVSGVT